MTEVVDKIAPEPWQPGGNGQAWSQVRETYGEFTGVARWIDRPWVFRIALGLIGIVYLCSLTPDWYPTSDSALYLMLGDNLADGQGYTLWGKTHTHVPPGFPLLLAGMKSVGIDTFLGRNLVMMLLAWGALTCCYFALRELVSPTFAKWLLLLLAFSHVMHLSSVRQLSDVPFIGIVWLGLWCQLRGLRTGSRTLEIGSFLLLASCLFRIVGLSIAIGAALGLLLQPSQVSKKRLWMNAVGSAVGILIVAGLSIAMVNYLGDIETPPSYFGAATIYLDRIWQSGFSQPYQNVLTTSRELSTLLTGQKNGDAGLLILLIWVPVVIGTTVNWKRGDVFGVCVFACYLVPLLMLRPLIARYLLPIAPFIFWYALEGVRWLSERTLQWKPRGQRFVVACALLLLLLNVPKAGKLAYRLQFPETDNSFVELMAMNDVARFLREQAQPGERFVTTENDRELSYLSGVWTKPSAMHTLVQNRPNTRTMAKVLTPEMEFVVIRNFGNRMYRRRIARAVVKYADAKKIYGNEQFLVFQVNQDLSQTARRQRMATKMK